MDVTLSGIYRDSESTENGPGITSKTSLLLRFELTVAPDF